MSNRRVYYEQEKNRLKELMIVLHSAIIKSPYIISLKGTEINLSIAYGVCLKFIKNILKESSFQNGNDSEKKFSFSELIIFPS